MHPESKQDYSLVYAGHRCAQPGLAHRNSVLVGLAIVVIVVVAVVGGVSVFLTNKWTAACPERSDRRSAGPDHKKVNISCPLDSPNANGEYEIFTANVTATYLIYGELRCQGDHQDWIYMDQRWKVAEPVRFHSKRHRYADACILEEVTVLQGSSVYLTFNRPSPSCLGARFRVYEL